MFGIVRGAPTKLEAALLHRIYERNEDRGFPDPVTLRVARRDNTGGGRYVFFEQTPLFPEEDALMGSGNEYKYVEMSGVPSGLMAYAKVKQHRLEYLEIFVNGDGFWDGTERDWTVVDAPKMK